MISPQQALKELQPTPVICPESPRLSNATHFRITSSLNYFKTKILEEFYILKFYHLKNLTAAPILRGEKKDIFKNFIMPSFNKHIGYQLYNSGTVLVCVCVCVWRGAGDGVFCVDLSSKEIIKLGRCGRRKINLLNTP